MDAQPTLMEDCLAASAQLWAARVEASFCADAPARRPRWSAPPQRLWKFVVSLLPSFPSRPFGFHPGLVRLAQ